MRWILEAVFDLELPSKFCYRLWKKLKTFRKVKKGPSDTTIQQMSKKTTESIYEQMTLKSLWREYHRA